MSDSADQHGMLYEGSFVMEQIRQYLLSVTAAAILCGAITSIAGKKGSIGGFIKMLCGIFLSITVIGAFFKMDSIDFSMYLDDLSEQTQNYTFQGSNDALTQMETIIKTQTQAYILDKASSLGADISANVLLTQQSPPVPCAVTISGAVSPYAKRILRQYIADELGILEENQSWILEP